MAPPRDGTDGPFITSEVWSGVDRLIDRAPSLQDLRAHRLHVLAARLWRTRRQAVPDALVSDEMSAAVRIASVRAALTTARGAYDDRIVVLKGLHSASIYPSPYLRPFSDLDLLADDPESVQRALLESGFVSSAADGNYYVGLHHLPPLRAPGPIPVVVEVHRRVNWVHWCDPPSTKELLQAAVAADIGVNGVLGLCPEHHVLVTAVHSWVELPLRRLGDLVDIASGMTMVQPAAVRQLAREWGVPRLWNTMSAATEYLILGGPRSTAVRAWARNLENVRDRTVLETHLRRLLSPVWGVSPIRAAPEIARAMTTALAPAPADTWSTKLRRSRIAVSGLNRPVEEHARILGPDGLRAPRFRRRDDI